MFISRNLIRQWHDLHQYVLNNGHYNDAIVEMSLEGILFRAYEHEDYDRNGYRSSGYYQLTAPGWRITSTAAREPQVFGDRKQMIRDMILIKLSGVLVNDDGDCGGDCATCQC